MMINASKKYKLISFLAWMVFATCLYYAGQKVAKYSDERRGIKKELMNANNGLL